MPWIKFGDKIIDIEIENYNNGSEFIEWLTKAFNGEKLTDKRGQILHLETTEEKQEFAYNLSMSKIFNIYVDKTFTENEKMLIDIILNF